MLHIIQQTLLANTAHELIRATKKPTFWMLKITRITNILIGIYMIEPENRIKENEAKWKK